MSETKEARKGMRPVQWVVVALLAAIAVGVFLWHFRLFLLDSPFWQSTALFLGVPLALAILFAFLSLRGVDKEAGTDEADGSQGKIEPAQWGVVALVIAFTAGAILYRWLMYRHLGHSGAMFLGIPGVLAILVALTPKAKTVTGGILKGMTLALLIVAPLLGEGYVCILFASPLFYVVGLIVGRVADWQRGKRGVTLGCIALVMLPMCLEGVFPGTTIRRAQSVEVTRIVGASASAVERALAQSPKVDVMLPGSLRIGFPRPLAAHGEGLIAGARRTIHFAGAEGDPPGDLVMRVAERRPGYVRFETASDSSKLTQWVWWNSSEIEWKQIDASHTAVTWRIHFERQLDPAWYFAPMERAAVREAANYLIEANATPRGEPQ
jgi:hypothetical protein